jgi:hypothetical protein
MKPFLSTSTQNKTEARYDVHLRLLQCAGEILDYRWDAINLRLGPDVHYRPDFLVVYPDRFEVHEVKGNFCRDDARVKVRTAAAIYSWWKFKVVRWIKGNWEVEEI